jgi:serine/threonine protein kinase/WD40 repeat protein
MVQGLKIASGQAACDNGLSDRSPSGDSNVTVVGSPSSGPAQLTSSRTFGDYELLEEIARGGMGIVYRAKQRSLDRIVAVKTLLFGPQASPEFVKRLRAEASAAASLHHQNIVAIHEVGVHQGEHYLVMDFVDGPNLARCVKEKPLSPRRAAGYLQEIAEAIHYAHERGVLHRDLKPSNVLIDSEDRPRVTDFGLARRLEGDSSLTLTGQVLGSPSYMPPEQAAGARGRIGRRSDVYSLGAMLYHALTGRPPFVGEALNETLDQVFHHEPVSPKLLNTAVPRDLETICLKCLEKEPSRRYGTARELADELGRFLRNEPISARPVSPPEKVWRWCRRNPRLATSLAGVASLLLVVAIGSPIAAFRINRERNFARQNLYAADMRVVEEAIEEGDIGRARELLASHVPAAGEADLRGFEWRYFRQRARGDQVATIVSDAGGDRHLAVSSDGHFLAAGRGVYDAASGGVLSDQRLAKGDMALTFAPDSHVLLISGRDGLKRRDLSTGEEVVILPGETNVSAVTFSRTGRWLATGSRQGLRLYDALTWKLVRSDTNLWFEPFFAAKALAFSPDEQTLVTAAGDPRTEASELQCWEVPSLKLLAFPANAVKNAACIAFSPDGQQFFTGCWDGILRVWDAATRTELPKRRSVQHHRSFIADMAFLPGTHQLVTAGSDRCIRIWGTELAERPVTLRGHVRAIRAMTLATNGAIYSLSGDGMIKKWSARSAEQRELLSETGHRLVPVGLSADGQVAVTLADGALKFWDVSQREFKEIVSRRWQMDNFKEVRIDPDRVREAGAVSPDLKWLALIRANQPAQLWNVSEHTVQTLPITSGSYAFAVFSPDSKLLALPLSTNRLALWDLTSRRQVASIPVPWVHEKVVSFAAGGEILAIGGETNVLLWSLRMGQPLKEFQIEGDSTVALSPDGGLLATGDTDNFVRLYDCQTGQSLRPPLQGHISGVERVAFSPDGRTLVSASRQWVKFWNVAAWREIASYEQPGRVGVVTFSNEGTTLLTSDGAGNFIQIWRAPFEEVHLAEKRQAAGP